MLNKERGLAYEIGDRWDTDLHSLVGWECKILAVGSYWKILKAEKLHDQNVHFKKMSGCCMETTGWIRVVVGVPGLR